MWLTSRRRHASCPSLLPLSFSSVPPSLQNIRLLLASLHVDDDSLPIIVDRRNITQTPIDVEREFCMKVTYLVSVDTCQYTHPLQLDVLVFGVHLHLFLLLPNSTPSLSTSSSPSCNRQRLLSCWLVVIAANKEGRRKTSKLLRCPSCLRLIIEYLSHSKPAAPQVSILSEWKKGPLSLLLGRLLFKASIFFFFLFTSKDHPVLVVWPPA